MKDLFQYFFNPKFFILTFPELMGGLLVTIEIAALSLILGLGLGLVLAVFRVMFKDFTHIPILRILNVPIVIYVDVFRAIPPLVFLVLVYYGLPFIGIMISRFWTAIITFVIILSAFSEEIFRATIEAIDPSQMSAARSLGLSYLQAMTFVLFPQAIRIALPPLTSRMVAITKDVSLASVIGVADLLKRARAAQALYANPTTIFSAALLFTLLFLPLVQLSKFVEKKLKQ